MIHSIELQVKTFRLKEKISRKCQTRTSNFFHDPRERLYRPLTREYQSAILPPGSLIQLPREEKILHYPQVFIVESVFQNRDEGGVVAAR